MPRRLLACVFTLLLLAPPLGTADDDLDLAALKIPFTKWVLPNGLTLVVHEDHKAPLVAVNIWYHVGSKNEKPGKTGFAHLFEHLMFNGSENYNDEFFRPLEAAGATGMNGTTSQDRTNYFETLPSSSLDLALWLESDRMGHLLGVIDQAKLDEQRDVVMNEKRQRENQPYGRAFNTIMAQTYPSGHPYSWPVIGSMEDLNAADLGDVKSWFSTWYGAANATLVVAGDVDPEQVYQRVLHYFGSIPAGPALAGATVQPAPMAENRRQVMQDRVPQTRLYQVWNLPDMNDPQIESLSLLSDVLAGGKGSRLHERLVFKEQLATDSSAFVWDRELGSQFFLLTTLRPGADVKRVEAIIDEELARLLDKGPSKAELSRIRTGFYADLVRRFERVGGFGGKADLLAESEVLGGSPDAWYAGLERYYNASANDIRQAGRDWLTRGRYTLEVQPVPNTETAKDEVDRSKLPAPGKAPALDLPELQHATLSNGMKVVLAERHQVPIVQFKFIATGGFSADPKAQPGTASLTMNLLDEGIPGLDSLALQRKLDGIGASISSKASMDTATVTLSALRARLKPALKLYAQVLRAPSLPEDQFKRLRAEQIARISQERNQPTGLILRNLPPLLFGENHPYGQPLTGSGTEAGLQSLSRDDVAAWHATWMRPDNASLLVVGDIDMATLKPLLEKSLGDWQAPDTPLPSRDLADVPARADTQIYLLHRPESEQSVIIAGQLAPPRSHPDDIALQAMNSVLGGLFTSRLNLNLREAKGWSYGASSFVRDAQGPRAFLAYAPVQADQTGPAMAEMRQEIAAIRETRPVLSEELTQAQRSLTLSLPGENETLGEVSGTIADMLIYSLPEDYYDSYVPAVQALQSTDLTTVAQRVLKPDQLIWVVVGDRAVIEPQLETLGWGKATIIEGR